MDEGRKSDTLTETTFRRNGVRPATKPTTGLTRSRLSARWMAWWYFTIAAGFLALAISRALAGGNKWLVGLRILIAIGFALLGWIEFPKRS